DDGGTEARGGGRLRSADPRHGRSRIRRWRPIASRDRRMTGTVDRPETRSGRVLPSGAVTFLFTDIEGSTRLLAALGDAYEALLDEHRERIRAAVAAAGG